MFSHFMRYDKACTHPCSMLPTVSLCARAARRALGHGICSNSAAVLLHRTAVPCPGARPEQRERNERGGRGTRCVPRPPLHTCHLLLRHRLAQPRRHQQPVQGEPGLRREGRGQGGARVGQEGAWSEHGWV